jgi:hypothetical protein
MLDIFLWSDPMLGSFVIEAKWDTLGQLSALSVTLTLAAVCDLRRRDRVDA